MATLKKSTSKHSEKHVIPDKKDGMLPYVEPAAPESQPAEEGQLAVDIFQTAEEIVVVAPIAGVSFSDISINVTITEDKDEVLTIKGARDFQFKVDSADYFNKECFWGNFSRSIILPEAVDIAKITASFKDGVLTVRIPKKEPVKTRIIRVTSAK